MNDLRERVEELGRGDFKMNTPKIEISTSFIEINLNVDEDYEGCFSLKSLNDYKMKGMVYTSTHRMQCMNSQFIGAQANILFRFSAKGICEGKSIKGKFYIISNGGELTLPFIINVRKHEILSSIGKISNLFHFTNLAASNWKEAFDVFQSPMFQNIFINNDKRYENIYLALTSGEVITQQCMEEFLVGIYKKSPVTLELTETQKSFYHLVADEKECIVLHKNTWGYVEAQISFDCDFIDIDKKMITTEDFIGSSYSIEYIIRKDRLHDGKNFGRITVKSTYSECSYEIVVTNHKKKKAEDQNFLLTEQKKSLLELTNLYISYRLRKTYTNSFAKECMEHVNTLLELDPENIYYKLFKVQFLSIQRKNYEANEILKEYEKSKNKLKEDAKLYAYYLYLTTFRNKESRYMNKVTEEVKGLYKKKKEWQILWVMLYMDHSYYTDNTKRLNSIEEQYFYHGNSPIMYAEAYRIIKSDVFLMQKLGQFEQQVLLWAVKNKVLSKDVALQAALLCNKVKEFHEILYDILAYGYEQFHDKEVLNAICKLLIHGNKTNESYFKWFRLGVEQEIRITRLYEYYMYTIPMDYNENIPKTVLMYFSYHNSLDYRKSALLYERVIKQRDIYPEIFQNYKKSIEAFMNEQLMLKRNNEKLAFIYDTMLSLNKVTTQLATSISEILFGCELYLDKPNIKSVSVVHKHLKQEQIYPVVNHKAYIHLYAKDYAISFLDEQQNRYLFLNNYQIKSLMDEDFYMRKCYDLEVENKNVKMNMSQSLIQSNLITQSYLANLVEILSYEEVMDNYKMFISNTIIDYCYEHDEDTLVDYMTSMDLSEVDSFKRYKVIEFFIMHGLYQRAYQEICEYGFIGISTKHLIKLTSRLIEEYEFEKEEVILDLTVSIFKEKKYDDNILKYLILYYNGSIKRMRDIWIASNRFDLDAYDLTERIILQILFTNEYIEEIDDIFDYYYMKGAKSNIAKAFLTYYAYLFLVENQRVGKKTFSYIKREEHLEGVINDTCKLAMLKQYANCAYLDTQEKEYVENTLLEFMKRNMYFKFYENFDKKLLEPYCYEGKYLVEYKADTKEDVFIHYIHEDVTGKGEYKVEKMKQSYQGIYHKLFTVFYGEKVQYYITQQNNPKDLVKNDIIMKTDMNLHDSNSRYNMLNDMSAAMQLHDDVTLLELMNKYAINSQAVEELFKSI